MALREDLLEPIAGENPSGENLRYAALCDQIREARREDVEVNQGVFQTAVKKADWPKVIKLAGDALATKSKDLQLAAWLTEAHLHKDGIPGLHGGIDLLQGLLNGFWDTLHPELEDGDAEMRAGILEWVGGKLDDAVKRTPVTRTKLDWYAYKESRAVGYEEDAAGNEAKTEARATAVAEGKLTAEDFDKGFQATPKQFYASLSEELEATQTAIRALGDACDEKFGDLSPSFSGLRESLGEFQQVIRSLLDRKRETEPDADQAAAAAEEEQDSGWSTTETAGETHAAAPARAPRGATLTAEPASHDDAVERVVAVARYLRREEPYSPVPYLMLRGLRFGELRAGGAEVDATLLEAPPTEIRQQLKRQSLDAQWQEVLEAAETAAGLPCGRGWLDLHRYAARACAELGYYYDPIAAGIRAEVRALLADYPGLPDMTLMDDTPAANQETRAWLAEIAGPPTAAAAPAESYAAPPAAVPPDGAAPETPDAYALALNALRHGSAQEALNLLTREVAQARTGRDRFLRRGQLAQICLASGKELIAYPILRDLAGEVEQRHLEEWEAPDVLAQPLVLLLKCMSKMGAAVEERQRVYERICRLDPVQAMQVSL